MKRYRKLFQQASEAFLLKVMIGRQRFRDSLFSHEYEADRITERVRLVEAMKEQVDCLYMQGLVDPMHGEVLSCPNIPDKLKCGPAW